MNSEDGPTSIIRIFLVRAKDGRLGSDRYCADYAESSASQR
jgi:hypothetical protein